MTALLQTAWHRSRKDEYPRLTRFFGTILVINVAIGVVTGLVPEFEFGMNGGAYSRLVGNIFGAPLAMEGLGAFFPESTFLGLWPFGWDKLPRQVHLLTIWLVAFGSAFRRCSSSGQGLPAVPSARRRAGRSWMLAAPRRCVSRRPACGRSISPRS